ncbi:hypothetical protein [Streptomyces sp. DH41]|uniref:hypothetical protein n=1 Tax=Streptomyces sp. DH41 TaxID=3040125 RepID=UPI002441288D|nr:hypothetical protein [Streptomyces sp. DH41]MDG9728531.1 hypothetical protein [Streptomyces sp. DH41]
MACVLLMRLMDHTSGDVFSPVLPSDLSDGKLSWRRREEMEAAIQLLKDRDLLDVVQRYQSSRERIQLTWAGKREATRITAERQAPGAWFNHTVERLVHAAFLKDISSSGLSSFAENLLFWGSDLNGSSSRSSDMVKRVSYYLRDRGLAELTTSTYSYQVRDVGYRWWNKRMRTVEIIRHKELKLTARGIDCVLSGKNVREYLSAHGSAGAGPVFNQNVYGGAAAQGVNVTQNVGVQPDQLANLIRQLRDIAPQLPSAEREEFLSDVEVLEDTDQPPQDRLSAGQRIKAALINGGSHLGGQAIVSALERLTSLV